MDIIRESVAEFCIGTGTVGTTAVKIHSGKAVVKGVVVKAGRRPIAIGSHSGVTFATGFWLEPGEQSPMIHIDDLAKVWVVGPRESCDYSWVAV